MKGKLFISLLFTLLLICGCKTQPSVDKEKAAGNLGKYSYTALNDLPADELFAVLSDNGLMLSDELKLKMSEREIAECIKQNFEQFSVGMASSADTAYAELSSAVNGICKEIADPNAEEDRIVFKPGAYRDKKYSDEDLENMSSKELYMVFKDNGLVFPDELKGLGSDYFLAVYLKANFASFKEGFTSLSYAAHSDVADSIYNIYNRITK